MTHLKLKGQELVDYCEANQGLPEKELVVGAGYYTELEDGKIQINTKPFYQAVMLAKGIIAPQTVGRSGGKRGKGLSYLLKTNHRTGNAVVTGGYLSQIGVEKGGRVSVEVIQESGELILKAAPVEGEEEYASCPPTQAAEPELAGAL